MITDVPTERIRTATDGAVDGHYVLYWMTAYRRTESNYSLQYACDWARSLDLPLVVLVPLRLDYPWANDRIHAFALDGIAAVVASLADKPVRCVPYIEATPGAAKGLLEALSESAAIVIGDDAPVFFLPAATQAAADRLSVRFDLVDHNGLVPLNISDRLFTRAYDLRRFYQKTLIDYVDDRPTDDPFTGLRTGPIPTVDGVLGRFAESELPSRSAVARLDLDRSVTETVLAGGQPAAQRRLHSFVEDGLVKYDQRNHPDAHAESGLSPYLHFGHISVHEVFDAVVSQEGWTPGEVSPTANGSRAGWWGMSPNSESFLDQVITWRDIGYRTAYFDAGYDQYDALPKWARATLENHVDDERPYLYSHRQLDRAETHDVIWNAAQRQLTETGVMHNYLRMLWGKKILEWTEHPRLAHDIMIDLNNRYALDGRDPNSISGIHWVLGRFDRAWGPERPIFGKVRYMTSESAKRKLKMKSFLAGEQGSLLA